MAVTIHAAHPNDLVPLIRDLQTLDGTPGAHRIRRAVHGSGAIVDEDLALNWLLLTRSPSPQFLERLAREDESLLDLIGRRAPRWALAEWVAAREPEPEVSPAAAQAVRFDSNKSVEHAVVELPDSIPTVAAAPARKAPRAEWETWARESGRVSAEQARLLTKAQLQELAEPTPAAAPKETKEG